MTIITISGRQGAGKTDIGKKLAKILNYENVSIGDLKGELAKDMSLTIDELNEIGKKEDWIHKKFDEKTISIGKTRDNFLIEAWLGYHFIPHSFKIFLEVKEDVAVKRIFKDQRDDEKKCKTEKEMKEMLNKRLKVTGDQFKKYYGINFLDKSNYDLIIDTTNLTKEQVIGIILKKLPKEKMNNIFSKKSSPKKKEERKEIIEVDFREKNSLVPSELIKQNLMVEFKELKVADYIVKGVAIERKTARDFFASLFNKRIFTQLENLKQYEKKLLIIEGELEKENHLHKNALRGLLLSIGLNYQVPIIFTNDEEETSKYIKLIANKKEKEISLNPNRKTFSKEERARFILESFPGIGPTKSKRLLNEFKSIKKIVSSTEKRLSKILGKRAKDFKDLLEHKYLEEN